MLGKLLKELRINKSITQIELSKGVCSRGYLSDVENGKSQITYNKFLKLIKKMNMTLFEFDLYLQSSVFREENLLKLQAQKAINSNDLSLIKRQRNELYMFIMKNSNVSDTLKHLLLLYDAVIEYKSHGFILEKNKYKGISIYLTRVDNWTLYELNLLNNFLFIFSEDEVYFFGKRLISKLKSLSSMSLEYSMILVKSLINLSDIYLKKEKYDLSKLYSIEAIEITKDNNWLFENCLAHINFTLATCCIEKNYDSKELDIYLTFLKFKGYDSLVIEIKSFIKKRKSQ